MKSTWFGSRARYEFARLVNEADYAVRTYELFGHFLECTALTFKQAVHALVKGHKCDDIEQRVCAIQERVKHPEKFGEALGALVVGLTEEPSDFLGTTFMEIGAADASFRGQCFTPLEVCRLMARMNIQHEKPIDGRTITFNDPACGGGAMLIATSLELQSRGFYPWHYHWHANDIDKRCFQMTYIQTTLLGIPAVVHHANTITMECWDSQRNLISVMHPEKRSAPSVEAVAEAINDVQELTTSRPVDKDRKVQATLFV